ncbi:unnamed protein product [Amoebophrya sp. A120]|nr:unnamed protein product [Amoebophrya sp. A120]|eukprot:GSA120T00002380001.1
MPSDSAPFAASSSLHNGPSSSLHNGSGKAVPLLPDVAGVQDSEAKKENEIRVAMLGNQCAGKTTLINALLRDQFGAVGNQRTTAGVNSYRVTLVPQQPTGRSFIEVLGLKSAPARPAKAVHESVKESDKKLRVQQSEDGAGSASVEVVHTSFAAEMGDFDIARDSSIPGGCPALTLVDFPGLNGIGGDAFKAEVAKTLKNFDLVLLVVDFQKFPIPSDSQQFSQEGDQAAGAAGASGAETDAEGLYDFAGIDDAALLKWFAKLPIEVPACIVINKVDDHTVNVFNANGRKIDSDALKKAACVSDIVPVSARAGLAWRLPGDAAHAIAKELDQGTLDRVVGETGMTLTELAEMKPEQKADKCANFLRKLQPTKRAELEEKSGMPRLLSVLEKTIGGASQRKVLALQIQRELQALSIDETVTLESLHSYYKRSAVLGVRNAVDYREKFFELFEFRCAQALTAFRVRPQKETLSSLTKLVSDMCVEFVDLQNGMRLGPDKLRDAVFQLLTNVLKHFVEAYLALLVREGNDCGWGSSSNKTKLGKGLKDKWEALLLHMRCNISTYFHANQSRVFRSLSAAWTMTTEQVLDRLRKDKTAKRNKITNISFANNAYETKEVSTFADAISAFEELCQKCVTVTGKSIPQISAETAAEREKAVLGGGVQKRNRDSDNEEEDEHGTKRQRVDGEGEDEEYEEYMMVMDQ